MLFYSGNILVDPSNADVIEELGMTIRPSSAHELACRYGGARSPGLSAYGPVSQ
jgi:hypothetical protein